MRRATLALCLVVAPAAAQAQDTAEAAIILQNQTIFLYADNTVGAVPMIARNGASLRLTFAQLHLGFPLPPVLTVDLHENAGVWHLDAITLEDPTRALAIAAPAFHIEVRDGGLILTGEILLHAAHRIAPIPIQIDLTLPTP